MAPLRESSPGRSYGTLLAQHAFSAATFPQGFLIWDGRPAALVSGYHSPSSPVERMIRSWSKQVAFSIGSGAGSGTERGEGAVVERSREADAFLTAIDQTAPE